MRVPLCRMASELLINIHKHAQATEAMLQLILNENELQLMAEDNGRGIPTQNTHAGVGLTNLQNRVNYLKGKLNIDSSPAGTTVIIQITLPA